MVNNGNDADNDDGDGDGDGDDDNDDDDDDDKRSSPSFLSPCFFLCSFLLGLVVLFLCPGCFNRADWFRQHGRHVPWEMAQPDCCRQVPETRIHEAGQGDTTITITNRTMDIPTNQSSNQPTSSQPTNRLANQTD